MQKKCPHYQLREHELLRRVQRCVSIVQLVPSAHHHPLSVRRHTIRSVVHILTLSATDLSMADVVGRNSCYGRVIWLLETLLVASLAARYQLLATKLRFAVTGMFGSHEQTYPCRVHRPSRLVRPVRPHRSQTAISPILFQRRRRRPTTTSIRSFYRPAVDEPGTRRCRRRYSRCRCHVVSCGSRRSHRRDRSRRPPELAAFTARNCSLCPRIAAEYVRMHQTTARHASSTRRVCAPPERCCIIAQRMTTAVTGQFAVPGNRPLQAPGVPRSVVSDVSGCCLRCCPWCCRACGAIPRWPRVTGAPCAAASVEHVTGPRRPLLSCRRRYYWHHRRHCDTVMNNAGLSVCVNRVTTCVQTLAECFKNLKVSLPRKSCEKSRILGEVGEWQKLWQYQDLMQSLG